MGYEVELTKAAARQIRKLDRQIQVRIFNWLEKLKDEPRPVGAIQLQGTPEVLYRIREGEWRRVHWERRFPTLIDWVYGMMYI